MNELNLIALYFRICHWYDTQLCFHCQRLSNNYRPCFTDSELLTIYFFAMLEEERFKVQSIYRFADRYLRSWFPQLPSYQAFNRRLNRLGPALQVLGSHLLKQLPIQAYRVGSYQLAAIDSLPIILAQGARTDTARIARPFADKGYCATKKLWYHGLKLHCLAFLQKGQLPSPSQIGFSPASEHDNTYFKEHFAKHCSGLILFADKIYDDRSSVKNLRKQQVELLAAQRRRRFQQSLTAYQKALSTLVSRHRQPIESFFNWLIEKTDIQRASKVRSFDGLLVFIFGRIVAAALLINGYY